MTIIVISNQHFYILQLVIERFHTLLISRIECGLRCKDQRQYFSRYQKSITKPIKTDFKKTYKPTAYMNRFFEKEKLR